MARPQTDAVQRELSEALAAARAHTPPDAQESAALREQIGQLLHDRDAVLVAHYYTDETLQDLALATGGHVADSLEMARFGHEHPAQTLIVGGVRFMGETAKILNPEKTVLMPNAEATCSLDLGCPADGFSAFCDEHPDRTVVVYANTSAAVKARADWMVTSGIALKIVRFLADRGEKILWAPDRHLGDYVKRQSGVDLVSWDGTCVVHDEFKATELQALLDEHQGAAVLVHPESPAAVLQMADVVGSTTALIEAAGSLPNRTLIVATDNGIFHEMAKAAPGKTLIEAPTGGVGATCQCCAHCPWMAANSLRDLANVLATGQNEIHIDEAVRQRALRPVRRMLDFAAGVGLDLAQTCTV